MIERRAIGSQGLVASAVGLGCMGMSQSYGRFDDGESAATIRAALDAGVTLFDTADMYGPYTNERLLGRALGVARSAVVVATKFGNVKNGGGRVVAHNGHPDYVREACEASLRRLRLEAIDLYFQHRVDPDTPVEETWGALSELVREGKVRYLGICEARLATVRRANTVHPVSAVQTEYSLLSREPERELLPGLHALGIGFMAYAPLGRGLLSGWIRRADSLQEDDWRRTLPRFRDGNLQHNAAVAEQLRGIAKERGVTVAQLAIAWVLAQGVDVTAIPGTKCPSRVTENVFACSLEFTDDELARIDAVAPHGAAAGDRYPDMSSVDA